MKKSNKKRRVRRIWKNLFMLVLVILIALGGFRVRALSVSAATVPTERIYHSIQIGYGDSLWSIADTYCEGSRNSQKREYVREIQRINHLANPNVLTAGESLIIYVDQPIR